MHDAVATHTAVLDGPRPVIAGSPLPPPAPLPAPRPLPRPDSGAFPARRVPVSPRVPGVAVTRSMM